MRTPPSCRLTCSLCWLLLVGVGLAGLPAEALAAQQPDSQPAEPKELSPAARKRAKTLEAFYTRIYTRPLTHRNWFVRAMAVTLLSRLETPAITDKLLEVLSKDAHPMVRLYAWDALHARNPVLTDEQRATWAREGLTLARRGTFKGDLRADLLKSVTEFGPEGLDGKVAKYYYDLLGKVRHYNPYDSRTLQQMRATVKAWNDPEVVRRTIILMSRPIVGYAAEYVLGGLHDGIEPLGRVDRKVSPGAWRKAQEQWALWARKANLTPTPTGQLPAYRGRSRYLPAARKLTDPDDPAWREDLELGKLQVSNFDLVFCLDMTGSMKPMIEWVAADAEKILAALKILSKSPRVGVVYYCHEVFEPAMAPCCKRAAAEARKTNRWEELMKVFPLTGNTQMLARKMERFDETGGHGPDGKKFVGWGAIYSALRAALQKQPWSRAPGAQKIIVCFGDSKLTEGTETMTEQLVADAGKRGFVITFIKVYKKRMKKLDLYDTLAEKGNGECFTVQISDDDNKRSKPQSLAGGQIAAPPEKGSVYTTVMGQVISSIVPKGYRQRVEPFVAVLMEYVDAKVAEP